MSHRRDSNTDAVHVIPTNDPPPEKLFPDLTDKPSCATDDHYSRVSSLNTAETESPCKKTRGSPSSSSSSDKPFFKTKLCCNFRAGNCPYSTSTCHFAHSVEELRLPTAAEIPGEVKIPEESVRPYKGRHCKKFYSGEGCPYGESCMFLHDEASRNRESFAISLDSRSGYGAAGDVVALNWKTRICNKWEMSGYCPFGTNCNFAHGVAELHRVGGGLVEEEEGGKIITSSTSDTKKIGQADTVTSLASPGVPSQRASTQKPNGVRVLRKWKGPDRISKVYGDWIDDIE